MPYSSIPAFNRLPLMFSIKECNYTRISSRWVIAATRRLPLQAPARCCSTRHPALMTMTGSSCSTGLQPPAAHVAGQTTLMGTIGDSSDTCPYAG